MRALNVEHSLLRCRTFIFHRINVANNRPGRETVPGPFRGVAPLGPPIVG
jgi:hypothetical protein